MQHQNNGSFSLETYRYINSLLRYLFFFSFFIIHLNEKFNSSEEKNILTILNDYFKSFIVGNLARCNNHIKYSIGQVGLKCQIKT